MFLYEIVWCFLDKRGAVQRDEQNNEQYFKDYVYAINEAIAVLKFEKEQRFLNKPEIIKISEFKLLNSKSMGRN